LDVVGVQDEVGNTHVANTDDELSVTDEKEQVTIHLK
jgi:hypothetical protein